MAELPEESENRPRLFTRRRFLLLSALATGGMAAGALALGGYDDWLLSPAQRAYHDVAEPELPDAPTGQLSAETAEALLGATRAVIALPIETGHYEDYFRWRAENLRGYKALYERFQGKADDAAQRLCGRPFAECDLGSQRAVLETDLQGQPAHGRWGAARDGIFQRDQLMFSRYIFRETLQLFAATDAWQQLGYDGWPGRPRGLEAYKLKPSGA